MRFKLKKNQKAYAVINITDKGVCGIPDEDVECAALYGERTGVTCKDFGSSCLRGKWEGHIFVEVSQQVYPVGCAAAHKPEVK